MWTSHVTWSTARPGQQPVTGPGLRGERPRGREPATAVGRPDHVLGDREQATRQLVGDPGPATSGPADVPTVHGDLQRRGRHQQRSVEPDVTDLDPSWCDRAGRGPGTEKRAGLLAKCLHPALGRWYR